MAQCARLGFTAVFPLNTALPAGLGSPHAMARHIYQANIAHLDRCDAVVANLDFFRGPEPDSGTCFEVGYAIARGKPGVDVVLSPRLVEAAVVLAQLGEGGRPEDEPLHQSAVVESDP